MAVASITAGHKVSSPRPRGLLRPEGRRRGPVQVVPAPAGVARPGTWRSSPSAGRPRARGGCSLSPNARAFALQSSPRPRGLLAVAVILGVEAGVVPAPAGVAPPAGSPARTRWRRPRARGGCSGVAKSHVAGVASSPRPRGLLRSPGCGGADRHVVPAPAGVARRCPAAGRRRPRRPRARGGCSYMSLIKTAMPPSSPRPRGLLQPARGVQGHAPVVPAPAGVARSRPGSEWTRSGRPRARGG